jgi:hypothetical protein
MFSKEKIIPRLKNATLVPVVVAAIISASVLFIDHMISAELTKSEQDIEVINQFTKAYYNTEEDHRRLAVHLIKLLNSEEKRKILCHFVIWDTLERNVHKDFLFDSEYGDWHLLGDVVYGMREHDKEEVNEYWCDVKKTALDRWDIYEKRDEFKKLFSWIRKIYQQDDIWEECS